MPTKRNSRKALYIAAGVAELLRLGVEMNDILPLTGLNRDTVNSYLRLLKLSELDKKPLAHNEMTVDEGLKRAATV